MAAVRKDRPWEAKDSGDDLCKEIKQHIRYGLHARLEWPNQQNKYL